MATPRELENKLKGRQVPQDDSTDIRFPDDFTLATSVSDDNYLLLGNMESTGIPNKVAKISVAKSFFNTGYEVKSLVQGAGISVSNNDGAWTITATGGGGGGSDWGQIGGNITSQTDLWGMFVAGSGISLTPNTTTKKITITNTGGSGGGSWGTITGDISDQTDLFNMIVAYDSSVVIYKDNTNNKIKIQAVGGSSGSGVWGSITGDIQSQTDLQNALATKADLWQADPIAPITSMDSFMDEVDALIQLHTQEEYLLEPIWIRDSWTDLLPADTDGHVHYLALTMYGYLLGDAQDDIVALEMRVTKAAAYGSPSMIEFENLSDINRHQRKARWVWASEHNEYKPDQDNHEGDFYIDGRPIGKGYFNETRTEYTFEITDRFAFAESCEIQTELLSSTEIANIKNAFEFRFGARPITLKSISIELMALSEYKQDVIVFDKTLIPLSDMMAIWDKYGQIAGEHLWLTKDIDASELTPPPVFYMILDEPLRPIDEPIDMHITFSLRTINPMVDETKYYDMPLHFTSSQTDLDGLGYQYIYLEGIYYKQVSSGQPIPVVLQYTESTGCYTMKAHNVPYLDTNDLFTFWYRVPTSEYVAYRQIDFCIKYHEAGEAEGFGNCVSLSIYTGIYDEGLGDMAVVLADKVRHTPFSAWNERTCFYFTALFKKLTSLELFDGKVGKDTTNRIHREVLKSSPLEQLDPEVISDSYINFISHEISLGGDFITPLNGREKLNVSINNVEGNIDLSLRDRDNNIQSGFSVDLIPDGTTVSWVQNHNQGRDVSIFSNLLRTSTTPFKLTEKRPDHTTISSELAFLPISSQDPDESIDLTVTRGLQFWGYDMGPSSSRGAPNHHTYATICKRENEEGHIVAIPTLGDFWLGRSSTTGSAIGHMAGHSADGRYYHIICSNVSNVVGVLFGGEHIVKTEAYGAHSDEEKFAEYKPDTQLFTDKMFEHCFDSSVFNQKNKEKKIGLDVRAALKEALDPEVFEVDNSGRFTLKAKYKNIKK